MKWNQRQLTVVFIGLIVTLGLFFLLFFNQKKPNDDFLWETFESTATQETSTFASETLILVDIKGAVLRPGVYELSPDARLNELILLAGGFTEIAEVRQINLAEKLNDQQMIYVPNIEEIDFSVAQFNEIKDRVDQTTLININTADLNQLQQLSGVGPAKAQAIIAYREEKGSFNSIEELLEVPGFGEKTFDKLKSSIEI